MAVARIVDPAKNRMPVVQRQSRQANVHERTIRTTPRGENTRTVVIIRVIGHASPRWRSATSARIADRNNARLAEQRGQSVRYEVERQLRALMPTRHLTFEY